MTVSGDWLSPPLADPVATDGWAQPRLYRRTARNPNPRHAGIDLRAAVGTPVLAQGAGTVSGVDDAQKTKLGKYVLVSYSNGLTVSYGHLSKITVAQGQTVAQGEQLGLSGRTRERGKTITQPHLHITVRVAPDRLPVYVAQFGTPKSGFFDETALGVAIPAEPLWPMRYLASVTSEALASGVRLYRGTATAPGSSSSSSASPASPTLTDAPRSSAAPDAPVSSSTLGVILCLIFVLSWT